LDRKNSKSDAFWCILVHGSGETFKRSLISMVGRVEECIIDASKNEVDAFMLH